LGGTVPVPVEIVAFGWETTAARLAGLGANPVLRTAQDGGVFRTDSGNLILDCHFGIITDPARLEQDLSATIGVVETGLFIGMATTALVATPGGIVRLDRP
jgi:ribose 5-phosphate isomerase A